MPTISTEKGLPITTGSDGALDILPGSNPDDGPRTGANWDEGDDSPSGSPTTSLFLSSLVNGGGGGFSTKAARRPNGGGGSGGGQLTVAQMLQQAEIAVYRVNTATDPVTPAQYNKAIATIYAVLNDPRATAAEKANALEVLGRLLGSTNLDGGAEVSTGFLNTLGLSLDSESNGVVLDINGDGKVTRAELLVYLKLTNNGSGPATPMSIKLHKMEVAVLEVTSATGPITPGQYNDAVAAIWAVLNDPNATPAKRLAAQAALIRLQGADNLDGGAAVSDAFLETLGLDVDSKIGDVPLDTNGDKVVTREELINFLKLKAGVTSATGPIREVAAATQYLIDQGRVILDGLAKELIVSVVWELIKSQSTKHKNGNVTLDISGIPPDKLAAYGQYLDRVAPRSDGKTWEQYLKENNGKVIPKDQWEIMSLNQPRSQDEINSDIQLVNGIVANAQQTLAKLAELIYSVAKAAIDVMTAGSH